MSYETSILIAFPRTQTGLTLQAQLYTPGTGTTVGGQITDGFTERGGGVYEWKNPTAWADDADYSIKFQKVGDTSVFAWGRVTPRSATRTEATADKDELISEIGDISVSGGGEISDASLAKLAMTGVNVSLPTLDGNRLSRKIIRGDSYDSDHGSAIVFSHAGWPTLSGTAQIIATPRISGNGEAFTIDSSGVDDNSKSITFELSSIESAALVAADYTFRMRVTFSDGAKSSLIDDASLIVSD